MREHVSNVGFFFDEYLAPRRISPEDGLEEVEHYLGDWLVNSYDDTSKTFLRSSATSLNKFYQRMAENGDVSRDRQQEVRQSVRRQPGDWVAAFEARDRERHLSWRLSYMRELSRRHTAP